MSKLVVGMGKTGLSVARYWQLQGDEVEVVDSQQKTPYYDHFIRDCAGCRLICGEDITRWQASRFASYDEVALSPGVDPCSLDLSQAVVTNDIALFDQYWRKHYAHQSTLLAVTGTNGKSTTTALVAHLFRELGVSVDEIGNIGYPVLDALMHWQKEGVPAVVVVELSSFQLEIAHDFYSDSAIVLNVSEDHVDRHKSMQRYKTIKGNIYKETRHAVINLDEPNTTDYIETLSEKKAITTISLTGEADWKLRDGHIQYQNDFTLPLSFLSLVCRLQINNVLAVLALVCMMTLDWKKLVQGLKTFQGLLHRQQLVACIDGISYINDSKATNVASTIFAVKNMAGFVVLIAGGEGKGQDFSLLANIKTSLRAVVLLGKAAKLIGEVFSACRIPCYYVDDIDMAVSIATKCAKHGDSVVLSPACSSLDMFDNYEARGHLFMQSVQMLSKARLS